MSRPKRSIQHQIQFFFKKITPKDTMSLIDLLLSFKCGWPIWANGRQLSVAWIKFRWPRLNFRNAIIAI